MSVCLHIQHVYKTRPLPCMQDWKQLIKLSRHFVAYFYYKHVWTRVCLLGHVRLCLDNVNVISSPICVAIREILWMCSYNVKLNPSFIGVLCLILQCLLM